jgi:hypothetical protein
MKVAPTVLAGGKGRDNLNPTYLYELEMELLESKSKL